MITSLEIKHFKSIHDLTVDLSPITIFVGPNGSGKSNIVDALRFLRDAVKFDLDRANSDRHGFDSIRQWSPSRKPFNVTISASYKRSSEDFGTYSLTIGSVKKTPRVIKEKAEWKSEFLRFDSGADDEDFEIYERAPKYDFSLERDKYGKSIILSMTRPGEKKKREFLVQDINDLAISDGGGSFANLISDASGWKIKSNRLFWFGFKPSDAFRNFEAYSIFPNTLRLPQLPTSDPRLRPSGDNLNSVFQSLGRSQGGREAKREILAGLKQLMPNLVNIAIRNVGGFLTPTFRVQAQEKAHDFNVSQISDGTLRVLGLLTALYQPNKPGVIALEEPEQMINPGAMEVIAEAIKEASSQTQVIVTTHSPDFIDYFAPECIRAVQMVDGETKAGPIHADQVKSVKENLFSVGDLMKIEGLTVG